MEAYHSKQIALGYFGDPLRSRKTPRLKSGQISITG
jgi:hypothetical protein